MVLYSRLNDLNDHPGAVSCAKPVRESVQQDGGDFQYLFEASAVYSVKTTRGSGGHDVKQK